VEDTIVAIASPPGQGAVAILRVSGSESIPIAKRIFRLKNSRSKWLPRVLLLGTIVNSDDETIDQVLLSVFIGPASYTGEDLVEITCHGGMFVTQAVLDTIISTGARLADPGEFSKRSFLNGKMDLTQAEAVMDLISARTALALRAANSQLEGRLGNRISELKQSLLTILAHVEAYIDFPEEDINPDANESIIQKLTILSESVGNLIKTAEQGRILREGLHVVISGPPNAGKSSLLNSLLGYERAIVSDLAGTTRDTIEEMINLKGIPVKLTDTAGIREVEELIESEGVLRAKRELKRADLVLTVVDATIDKKENEKIKSVSSDELNHIKVFNKADLGIHNSYKGEDGVQISCLEGTGIELLVGLIVESCLGENDHFAKNLIAVNSRHRACLESAHSNVNNAINAFKEGVEPEFVSVDLREALDSVGEIVGKADVEDLLGEIFSSFCIGK
jgi:tRNA modification GTPase